MASDHEPARQVSAKGRALQPVKREPFFMDQRCGLLKADRLMVEIKTFCDVDVPLFSVMCWDFRGHTEVLP